MGKRLMRFRETFSTAKANAASAFFRAHRLFPLLLLCCIAVPAPQAAHAAQRPRLSPLAEWVVGLLPATALPAYQDMPRVRSALDTNGNGNSDTDDIIVGAREEVARRPFYRSAYYSGGYPPPTEGVCTDLIWRALQYAGYDLKKLITQDIRANRRAYPHVTKPDSNIDFRRVPNQRVFFARHGRSLTTKIIPDDKENLSQWQPGDIVTFTNPNHIVVLSDKRNAQGIPLILHNDGPVASEEDAFMKWYARGITGHYRFPSR